MSNRIDAAVRNERGFTLVEVLVVMMIIGLLAAIAIPAFFNQRSKANDAGAKEAVHSIQTALETYSSDNSGAYTGATLAALETLEAVLPPACTGTPPTNAPCVSTLTVGSNTFTVTVTARTTLNEYSIVRPASGPITYQCTVPAGAVERGGCPTSGFWN